MSQNINSPGPGLSADPIESFFMARRLLAAVAALIFYEYAISFGQEMSLVWKRKINPGSCLLLKIRWTLLFEAIALVLPQPSPERCGYNFQLPDD
ncbi:uncharacterized protein PHACADRAFT_199583 [Phanerochaete carnosa HHB-10118-sp]|uniref:DUF6533 domain-containing protein n=1 Tax=Phanerochaete carnosa (strain HHB-10118-sp) TaxID=650164 RepID=K5WP29_PHACS|nr:uncharacterized protein PHACADRAFT_199583 [Phanerochaete carnosa HHB-10118-sp]EKM52087.1 hypothetical protein PHACADRAFT_199583 [Phanerochaete carnosa HHB-10118-sp]